MALLALSNSSAGMMHYTTVPWLCDTYAPIVYQRSHRLMFQVTCLFQNICIRYKIWQGTSTETDLSFAIRY